MNTRYRAAIAILLALFQWTGASCTSDVETGVAVDPILLEEAAQGGAVIFWVTLSEQADLRAAAGLRDWKARGEFVHDALRATASASQARLRGLLRRKGVSFRPFWIINTLKVTGDEALIRELAAAPEVAHITADEVLTIPEPTTGTQEALAATLEWNLANIRAEEAWQTFGVRGEGIIVAHIDSGATYDHPALVAQYRGNLGDGTFDHNYNWLDPSSVCGSPSLAPCDSSGHGSHTMGTMVGDDGGFNQIGVAPKARWITAMGCESSTCSRTALLASGEWVLAPTDLAGLNPRPDLRPHIVNNSWGSNNGTDTFYQPVVQSWVAAGVFPVFANGNAGPLCSTVRAPASYPESVGVGAYDISNGLATFSSKGPSPLDGGLKPNIAAPGVSVRSAWNNGGYNTISGTSMAAPHVAGAVALMWSMAPDLRGDIATTRAILDQSAVDTAGSCTADDTLESNNHWGEGRLDAFEAVRLSPIVIGPKGTIAGTIVNASSGAPIAGAAVEFVGPVSPTVFTDAAGQYTAALPVGSYDATASAFGYFLTTTPVTIIETTAATLDFSLALKPTHTLSGVVRDHTGAPVAGASVTMLRTPFTVVLTDANGFYSVLGVPVDSYEVSVVADAQRAPCNLSVFEIVTIAGDVTFDVDLPVRRDAFDYTCNVIAPAYIQANTVIDANDRFHNKMFFVELPFLFTYYAQNYSGVWVSPSDFISFVSSGGSFSNNGPIPSSDPPDAAIFPFRSNAAILNDMSSRRTETVGTAPNRQFVIEWRKVLVNDGTRFDMEIILGEDNSIQIQYRGIAVTDVARGSDATIGIENETGGIGHMYSFKEPLISSPTFALRYVRSRNPAPNTSHIGDLDGNVVAGTDSWIATATAEVHDDKEQPVANAVVSGFFLGIGSVSCTTDITGRCSVTSAPIANSSRASVTFEVSGVTHASLTYQPIVSHDPDKDSAPFRLNRWSILIGKRMHSGDLDSNAIITGSRPSRKWTGTATVEIHDEMEQPISGAVVSGTFTGLFGGATTCTTDITGRCSLFSPTILEADATNIVFTIKDVTHSEFVYDSFLNHDPDGDSTRLSIEVFAKAEPPPEPLPVIGVHVGDLDASVTVVGRGRNAEWTGMATIEVHDETELPLAGAIVTGAFTTLLANLTCTTDAAGRCTISSPTITKSEAEGVTFVVSNVTVVGDDYVATGNHDPDGDSDGKTLPF